MIKYQDLVEGVRSRADLDDVRASREVIATVLAVLVRATPPDQRDVFVDALPGQVRDEMDVSHDEPGGNGLTDLLGDVATRLGRPQEQARYLAQAVLAELGTQDRQAVETVAAGLPDETASALLAAGDRPGDAVTTTPERPTVLSADEVASALTELEGWEGDEHAISRTVAVPDDRIEPLVRRVEQEARQHNDHATVQRGRGAVTFTLRTRGAKVTRPDVDLAARIDAAVADVGSGG